MNYLEIVTIIPFLMGDETKAQRGEGTCLRSQSWFQGRIRIKTLVCVAPSPSLTPSWKRVTDPCGPRAKFKRRLSWRLGRGKCRVCLIWGLIPIVKAINPTHREITWDIQINGIF